MTHLGANKIKSNECPKKVLLFFFFCNFWTRHTCKLASFPLICLYQAQVHLENEQQGVQLSLPGARSFPICSGACRRRRCPPAPQGAAGTRSCEPSPGKAELSTAPAPGRDQRSLSAPALRGMSKRLHVQQPGGLGDHFLREWKQPELLSSSSNPI